MTTDILWLKDVPSILEDPKDILRNYILKPETSFNDPPPEILYRIPNIENVYCLPDNTPSMNLYPQRDILSGKILDFFEMRIQLDETTGYVMPSRKMPNSSKKDGKTDANHFPFWFGNFDDPLSTMQLFKFEKVEYKDDLLTVPPGFTEGVNFEELQKKPQKENEDLAKLITANLANAIQGASQFEDWDKDEEVEQPKPYELEVPINEELVDELSIIVDPVLRIENSKAPPLEFAENVDISFPVVDFFEKIPVLAKTYPFELDVFQKQAILKLEEGKHVLVAAHTSAGKTVVAEYAIALSQKHMTKAIYTSPVKALSNQKYQDFRKIFNDVGLITGDLQINPAASCLIMTTEILRSMLYCNNDCTRDMEYVIFDEIHYINDEDRGHVWEEVLILLPPHVQIIMLSATVPNTLEFADWVGSIKGKKVYVIHTVKRPIPLVHHLYTGFDKDSKDDIFMIVDEKGKYYKENYEKAKQRLKTMQEKGKLKTGQKQNYNKRSHKKNENDERDNAARISVLEYRRWNAVVDFLKENDKLPAVAFTLSRNRCDQNATALNKYDLNSPVEKTEVREYFEKCIKKLSPADRIIPQVKIIQNTLERGIGIHHSGILPILKEIVEMSFQRGWVKLLFATETFAMGVNMPTRTVVFDSHEKYDGVVRRLLQPAEYIQMAGRAGRRGHDKIGTVMLICKQNVPSSDELCGIILGRPKLLKSRFRLKYATILNLLLEKEKTRSVESIMLHSFKEFDIKKKIPENEKKLEITKKELSGFPELGDHLKPLCDFYDLAKDYISKLANVMKTLLTQPKLSKELKSGRVLIVTQDHHYNKLGILLTVIQQSDKEPYFQVLVLDHQLINCEKDDDSQQKKMDRGELWHKMLSLSAQYKKYTPEGIGGHAVLKLKSSDIVEVTKTVIKVGADSVLKNWENRQLPRFKYDPPGPITAKAVNELYDLNTVYNEQKHKIQLMPLSMEASTLLGDSSVVETIDDFFKLKKQLKSIQPYTNIANFEHDFSLVFDRKSLEEKIKILEFKISEKNLSLYPEYCDKLKVLEELNHINNQNEITMKGRVACKMGQNELIITELVLCNMFNDLKAAEIAALLSALVFQGKSNSNKSTKIPPRLLKYVEKIQQIDNEIIEIEKKFNVFCDETLNRLNFGLIEVVYEWARNKPFADILNLTDNFQEGIIVRCIQQLNEILRDVKTAAMTIGNPALQQKMEDASNAIKRDIVFAVSLYTSDDI